MHLFYVIARFQYKIDLRYYAWVQNDGVLKMRKLKKLVLKALEESGITDDETKLSNKLEHKVCGLCDVYLLHFYS